MFAIKDQEFKQFARYVRTHYGIHFKKEKKALIAGRLGPLLVRMNFKNLSDYLEYVIADKTGRAASLMLDRITTNHTYFMREPAHFHYFQEQVLPYLEKMVTDKDLRIWSAACASGEEPYTLAMIIDDYFGPNKGDWDTKILATDISLKALSIARAGIYSRDKIKALPPHWIKRYFKKNEDGNYILSKKIKEEVIYGKINLVDCKFPFKRKMHVIFCRNVMIYFDIETKERLAERLYEITEPGGFLFISHSENLNREKTRYSYIMPAVYRKE